ncbi:MAG: polymorphic toxin type 50 domain-containing protein [Sphaerochaetaceae bacterium]|nr:polymorphic toxin type 50 domain-containing protein [Sphaerochaetaceae bacterium]MDD4007911.1 polymorphic toxin type 50 domain-containing protein [Sphaerochaetaceae bacterium]MDD4396953.1 polymorphic toxin type 50 domain-containing protein [Sphaerochaetaceae bacterium]
MAKGFTPGEPHIRGDIAKPYQTYDEWKQNSISNANIKSITSNLDKTEDNGIIESEVVARAVKDGTVNVVVNEQKQNRHIPGAKEYQEGRSYINGTIDDARALVEKLHGTGTALFNANGVWNHKERVTNDTVIGVHVDNKTGLEKETKNGIISYSKTGTHIVPSRGGEK